MKQIYKNKLSIQELKTKGFRYDMQYQNYTYEFPVYKYKRKPFVICKVFISEEDKSVRFNVYNVNGNLYTAYYNREYGRSLLIKLIEKNIEKEFRKLGFKREGDSK